MSDPEQWVVLIDHERLPDTLAGFKTARVLAVGSSRAEAKERGRPQLDSIYSWGCHFTGPIRGPVHPARAGGAPRAA